MSLLFLKVKSEMPDPRRTSETHSGHLEDRIVKISQFSHGRESTAAAIR